MIAIASCWPPEVAAGSGTTVSQNRLVEALRLVGVEARLIYTSCFATNRAELAARQAANASFGEQAAGAETVLGIDGEGWLWAPQRPRVPFVAFCEAVLAEVVPFEQGETAELLRQQAAWEAAAAHAADAVVARSEFAASRIVQHYGIDRRRITVLPIPFDIAAWQAALPELPREPLVLAAGHLYARKNYRALLSAWPAVTRACPEAELAMVGTGPEQLPAGQPGVRLLGHVSFAELQSLYARASVFCHPSLQENFGISVVEGLASGAGVVTHHQAAVLESTNGLPGTWAVDASEPAELAEALIAALQSPRAWPDSRLAGLRRRLDPVRVGRQLRLLIDAL